MDIRPKYRQQTPIASAMRQEVKMIFYNFWSSERNESLLLFPSRDKNVEDTLQWRV